MSGRRRRLRRRAAALRRALRRAVRRRVGAAALRRSARAVLRRHVAALRDASGQAAVELVGMLPIYVAVMLAVTHVLVAGVVRELAGHAAEAAAIAKLRGEDPTAAARAALPGWSRKEVTVKVDGRQVRVRVAPPAIVPGVGDALASTVSADAGPA